MHAVTLDAHGVLLLPDPAALRAAAARFGVTFDDARCWQAYYEMGALLDAPTVDYDDLNRAFAAALGLTAEHQDLAAPALRDVILSTSWVPAPGAVDAVAALVAAGLRVGIISNTAHGEIETLLARLGVCEVGHPHRGVDLVLDSQRIGIRKPDAAVFDLALEALGAAPASTVHVGDSLKDDVDGARAAGLSAVHIDPLARCHREDHDHAKSIALWVENVLTSP